MNQDVQCGSISYILLPLRNLQGYRLSQIIKYIVHRLLVLDESFWRLFYAKYSVIVGY